MLPGRSTLRAPALALLVAVAATGCVLPDQLSKIEKDLADVRQELRTVRDEQAAAQAKLAELESGGIDRPDVVERSELAAVKAQVDGVERSMRVVEEGILDVNRRIDRVTRDVDLANRQRNVYPPAVSQELPPSQPSGSDAGTTPAGGASPTTPPAAGGGTTSGTPTPAVLQPPADPEVLYNTSYADFSKGNYRLAIDGFQRFTEAFPTSQLADNALYWVGECYYSQGDFSGAVRAFDQMLGRYPDSDKAAAAHLKKALAFEDENRIREAIIQLRFVVENYPDSDEAKIARDRLSVLGVST